MVVEGVAAEIYSDYDEEANPDELDPEQFTTNRRKWPR
jgi:hypothetical protein